MKKLKIYKSAIALLTATSILLLSGCSSSKKSEDKSTLCKHATIYFGDESLTFKECEGYEIDVEYLSYKSRILYDIKQEGKEIVSGATATFNVFDVNHDNADKMIENKSIKKAK